VFPGYRCKYTDGRFFGNYLSDAETLCNGSSILPSEDIAFDFDFARYPVLVFRPPLYENGGNDFAIMSLEHVWQTVLFFMMRKDIAHVEYNFAA